MASRLCITFQDALRRPQRGCLARASNALDRDEPIFGGQDRGDQLALPICQLVGIRLIGMDGPMTIDVFGRVTKNFLSNGILKN